MLGRLHLPLLEPEDVVRHLGHQERHWKAGRSAHALTNLWCHSKNLPKSIAAILNSNPAFGPAELIDAFLERQTDIGSPGRASQTDLLAVIGLKDRIAVLAVEAKAGESFGEPVRRWFDGSKGKETRLSALCKTLCMTPDAAQNLRYQLLHRSASAIYEAKRYRTNLACMVVQSFAPDDASFADFSAFLWAIGIKSEVTKSILLGPVTCEGVSLHVAWIDEGASPDKESRYLSQLRSYADRLSQYCDQLRAWCLTQGRP